MLLFPNAKINIGLDVLGKRSDGYHNIKSVLLPVEVFDILEILPSENWSLTSSGLAIDSGKNILSDFIDRFREINNELSFKLHLHKMIPVESGLGGASSDLAFLANYVIGLTDNEDQKKEIKAAAEELSSDVSFFFKNRPAFAEGKGEIQSSIDFNLSEYEIALFIPIGGVSTEKAYASIDLSKCVLSDWDVLQKSLDQWKGRIGNDFESFYETLNPDFKRIKTDLYNLGASYVSLTGSGSAFYAIHPKGHKLRIKDLGYTGNVIKTCFISAL